MNTPFFSIITPCYQAGDKLRTTVESVLSQTFSDYEIIVKDAGSMDGSIGSLPQDERIRLIQKKDGGIYDGMNQAVFAARGEFLYFLNCGDRLHEKDVLEKTAGIIQETIRKKREAEKSGTEVKSCGEAGPAKSPEHHSGSEREKKPGGWIFYGDIQEEKTGQRVAAKPEMTHFAMYRNLPNHQACFYSRSLFETRAFDLRYRVRADYEHFLWSVIRQGAEAVAMNQVIADYEGGGFSETKENRAVSEREHQEITGMYFTPEEIRRFRAAMLLSLQPVREKLAASPKTAAAYDWIKNKIYHRR